VVNTTDLIQEIAIRKHVAQRNAFKLSVVALHRTRWQSCGFSRSNQPAVM